MCTTWVVVAARSLRTPAQQKVTQRLSEVSTGWNEDEEVAGVVSQRQTAEDVLYLPIVEMAFPRDVREHLLIK